MDALPSDEKVTDVLKAILLRVQVLASQREPPSRGGSAGTSWWPGAAASPDQQLNRVLFLSGRGQRGGGLAPATLELSSRLCYLKVRAAMELSWDSVRSSQDGAGCLPRHSETHELSPWA